MLANDCPIAAGLESKQQRNDRLFRVTVSFALFRRSSSWFLGGTCAQLTRTRRWYWSSQYIYFGFLSQVLGQTGTFASNSFFKTYLILSFLFMLPSKGQPRSAREATCRLIDHPLYPSFISSNPIYIFFHLQVPPRIYLRLLTHTHTCRIRETWIPGQRLTLRIGVFTEETSRDCLEYIRCRGGVSSGPRM